MMNSLASSVNESQHNKKANRFAVRMQKHMDGSNAHQTDGSGSHSHSKEKERESNQRERDSGDSHSSTVSRKNTE
jgi:hypothetical protein